MTSDSLVLWVRNAIALFEQIVVQANREVQFLEKGESANGEIKESELITISLQKRFVVSAGNRFLASNSSCARTVRHLIIGIAGPLTDVAALLVAEPATLSDPPH